MIFGRARPWTRSRRNAARTVRGFARRQLAWACEGLEDRRLLTATSASEALDPSVAWAYPQLQVDPQSGEIASPQAGSAAPGGYTPAQLRRGYGFDQIFFAGGTIAGDGTGQTIAIVNAYHTPTALADLTAFSNYFGLPMPASFTQVNQTGGTTFTSSDAGWALETALDIQWAHALAPGASILLVEANSASFNDLGVAIDYARSQPGVSIISMSWGGSEYSGETAFDSHFATPTNHANVAFFAAAGNSGTPGMFPAYSNDVMAVGGTTLSLDAAGNYLAESSWGSSGGGISVYETQPSWQNGVVTQSATHRTMPDVAFLANPNTGVPVYDTFNNSPGTPWTKVAGTSFATPAWASLVAIADQGRNLAGLPVLDIPELMTAIYAMPASNFHDITVNGGPPANAPAVGYDLVTGRGTPKALPVVEYLVGLGSISGTVFNDVNGNTVYDSEPALAGWTVYADLDSDATFDALSTNNFSNTTSQVIPTIGTITSNRAVSGLSGRVVDVNVTTNINHSNPNQLLITLIAPDGTRIALADHNGNSSDNFSNTTFDDSAAVSIKKGVGPFNGSYHPVESLLDLFAKNPNGTWQLEVQDTVAGSGGTLTSWTLNLTTGDPSDVSAADGSYYIDALPVGSYQVREVLQSPYVQSGPAGGFHTVSLAFAQHAVNRDFGNQAPASATPVGIVLLAASDTGASSSDQITRLNNANASVALSFQVSGTVAGATVTLYSDGVPIGSATAGGSTTVVVTNGSTLLADGTRNITARQTEPGKSQSADSAPLEIHVDTQAPQATLGIVTPDPRTTPVPQMSIGFNEAVSGLELGDLSLVRDGGPNLLSGAQTPTSGDGISWTIPNLSGLTTTPGFYELTMSPGGAPLVDLAGNVNSDVESTSFTVSSSVLGRFLFYNDSIFDGDDPAANAADDLAIAPDKSAYLPGAGLAIFANVSSYSRGINGIAIDITGTHAGLTANDFVFKLGNNNSPASWSAAPAPSAVTVRSGAGVSGADRIEITWANGAIANTWLEVTVLPTANTQLAEGDVFFWGSKVGDIGDPTATSFTTTAAGDVAQITAGGLGPAGGITNVRDIDRSNTITASSDRSAALANLGGIVRIDIGAAGPFAPQAAGDGTQSNSGGAPESVPSTLAVSESPAMSDPAPAPDSVLAVAEPTFAAVAELTDPAREVTSARPLGPALPRALAVPLFALPRFPISADGTGVVPQTPVATPSEQSPVGRLSSRAASTDELRNTFFQFVQQRGGDRPQLCAADENVFEALDDELVELLAVDRRRAAWRLGR
ncbi:MAG: proprotein convertase P-domain-containing protein [Pirellulales bacterium]